VASRFAAGVTDHLRGSSAPRPGWKARVHLCRQLEAARGKGGKRGEGAQYIAAAGRREAAH